MNEKVWKALRNRRSFLKSCGVVGAGAVVGAGLGRAFDSVRVGGRRRRVSRTEVSMGTFVTIAAVDESSARAEEAIGLAFAEIERLVGVFSRHRAGTAVSTLNQYGVLTDPPLELVDLVGQALVYNKLSRGAFDVTVAPVISLLERGVEPTEAELADALSRVGSDGLVYERDRIAFSHPGMSVTFDGLAKGFIVDRASDVLAGRGVADHLVNAGGDIRARGRREDGEKWTIAVEDPKKRGHYPARFRLSSGAVATSGSYEIFYDEERVHHHIVDPHRGTSPGYHVSATVISGTVAEADAFSTSVFVLPDSDGLALIDSLPGRECLLIARDGTQRRSAGWVGVVGT